MNAPVDRSHLSLTSSSNAVAMAPTPAVETVPADDDKICWIEVTQSPFAPDQQVELLHLQAEAEALLLQLQALQQKRPANA